jgi:hypothetical protein
MKGNKNKNALKHGIFAQLLLKGNTFGEEEDDYCNLVSALRRAIKPVGELEDILVEKLAALFFRLSRAYKWDAKIAPRMFARVASDLVPGKSNPEVKSISPLDQIVLYSKHPTTDNTARHEASIERNIAKTFNFLVMVRQLRQQELPALAPALPETVDEE